ncbi:UPF0158 family protein [Thermomonospora umbrina]|uniref:Uncharacterized protein UPF0158 n=1 Tax=Thermomonospora umbrina TaxID=111806 RepID=A0A3D9SRT5_9ACTN|nr:UPF0158 family protein [Thermomonospora umbrina]REE98528.1 uncharacterized protein UPF0158 [Thermomonospora umbrina]
MNTWDGASLERLRAAVHRRDGAEGVRLLAEYPPGPVLQYAGDVLVAALGAGVPEAGPLARQCLEALTARALPGDAELADDLAAALGLRPPPEGHAVPVDLGELGSELDAEPEGEMEGEVYVVDLRHGDVLSVGELNGEDTGEVEPAFDESDERYDAARWLPFWPDRANAERDMADFAAAVADEALRPALAAALAGRWPYRRFLEAIRDTPDDTRWLLFREERRRGRARAWLAAHGYRPGPRGL